MPYTVAVYNMNRYLLGAMGLKLGKKEVSKSSEEFHACIDKSELNISITGLLNDKDKDNQALRIKILELKSTIEELASFESMLIDEL